MLYFSCNRNFFSCQGSNVPLVVKWADTEKERHARRAQKAQSRASIEANGDPSQQSSLFGAMPMGYGPAYNGYGYQVCFINKLSILCLLCCTIIFKHCFRNGLTCFYLF